MGLHFHVSDLLFLHVVSPHCCLYLSLLLSEGYQVLFRVALTIFKINGPHINSAADDIQVSRILQNTPRGLIDCDAFLEVKTCLFSLP